MKAILVLLMICCTSCSGWHHDAYEISQRKYILDVYDCSDKASDFQSMRGGKVVYVRLKRCGTLHALNVYHGWVIDCTTGEWHRYYKDLAGTISKHWGEYLPNLVTMHSTDRGIK